MYLKLALKNMKQSAKDNLILQKNVIKDNLLRD